MKLKTNKKDNTRNERQARRREHEKQWLKENGWQSWEALHTALMKGTASLSMGGKVAQAMLEKLKK